MFLLPRWPSGDWGQVVCYPASLPVHCAPPPPVNLIDFWLLLLIHEPCKVVYMVSCRPHVTVFTSLDKPVLITGAKVAVAHLLHKSCTQDILCPPRVITSMATWRRFIRLYLEHIGIHYVGLSRLGWITCRSHWLVPPETMSLQGHFQDILLVERSDLGVRHAQWNRNIWIYNHAKT